VHRAFAALLLAALGGASARAASHRGANLPATRGELSISFSSADGNDLQQTGGGQARLELGAISAKRDRTPAGPGPAHGRSRSASITRRRIAVRLESANGLPRFVRLRALLQAEDPRCRVRIDGITLTTLPQLIDAHAPVGPAVAHTIEVEVPASEPEGPVFSAITWLAETE
jgi:hypothetical protein